VGPEEGHKDTKAGTASDYFKIQYSAQFRTDKTQELIISQFLLLE